MIRLKKCEFRDPCRMPNTGMKLQQSKVIDTWSKGTMYEWADVEIVEHDADDYMEVLNDDDN